MVCYLVLTHRNTEQIARLTRALLADQAERRVVVHHDQSAERLARSHLPADPRLDLLPFSRAIRWGEWSIVQTVLDGLRWIEQRHEPSWVVLLSGQDFPTGPMAAVEERLRASPYDAYVDGEVVPLRPRLGTTMDLGRRYAFRYVRVRAPRALRPAVKAVSSRQRVVTGMWDSSGHGARFGVRWRTPFTPERPCRKGSAWVTLGRRAIERVLEARARDPGLVRHFRRTILPDESFFQTLLLADGGLSVRNEDLTFAIWDDRHPRTLRLADADAITASGKPFARKFDLAVDRRIVDSLERVVVP